ncbi:hypothetical protein B6U56_04435 [Ligilactobacillus salivarius]|uniref:Type II toxin-antitoxin system RelE/ParE family toxin n=1 Tax=Ligilactobacillus salivarius TaxID=1624 RepID=A0A1V9RBJ1_9LACO|nr:hypothetical protein B6U56_04435 [Ligilactobacillus salivarius]
MLIWKVKDVTYKIKVTRSFDKKLSNLPKLFNLTKEEAQEVLEEITFAMNELQKHGELPIEYADHVLERKPWIGYNEFHVLDDLLVVYFKVEYYYLRNQS